VDHDGPRGFLGGAVDEGLEEGEVLLHGGRDFGVGDGGFCGSGLVPGGRGSGESVEGEPRDGAGAPGFADEVAGGVAVLEPEGFLGEPGAAGQVLGLEVPPGAVLLAGFDEPLDGGFDAEVEVIEEAFFEELAAGVAAGVLGRRGLSQRSSAAGQEN